MTISYLIILGIIATFSIGVDYAFGASVSIPQGTGVPGCEETNECFIPYEFSILVGGQVTWTNDDPAAHTVTAGSQADGSSGFFDSNLLLKGTTFSYQFNEAGIYPYFCKVHPWMNGIVKVGYHLYLPPSLELDAEPSDQSIQKIPEWVRNIFVWYAENQVSEDELLNAIKYLINEEIIKLD